MLVNNSTLKLACLLGTVMFAVLFMVAAQAQAQQTPSQRYLPVRKSAYQTAPARSPSIENARRLPPANFLDEKQAQAPAPAPSIPNQSVYYPEQQAYGMVQRTSYQEPLVPEILAGGDGSQPATSQAPLKNNSNFVAPSVSPIASPMRHTTTTDEVTSEMQRMRLLDQKRRAAAQTQQSKVMPLPKPAGASIPVNIAPLRKPVAQDTFAPNQFQRLPIAPASPLQTPNESMDRSRMVANQTAADRIQQENTAAQAAATLPIDGDSQISATQFFAGIKSQQSTQEPQAPATAIADSPKLVAMQGQEPISPALQLTNNQQQVPFTPLRDEKVAQATRNVPAKLAMIELAAPSISVVTKGPKTIGINKPVQYEVVVQNNSIIPADRILVGIKLPSWVDIENVTLTSGGKEVTDGKNKARLVWSVDQIEGNSNQTLTITAIPRKAEIFDVGVEWTLVPRTGKAIVRVTEPKLEMNITGPKEVLYGEKALYHVSVRNPGTGTAENVVIMLPEALGGQRQTLDPIPAGKEKNLQIELLARTAGDLNLVATATAEGNLKTSAESKLTVRRGNLQVAMTGPPIRYSGDTAKYTIKVSNTGDATASEVVTAVALPPGVKYLSGIDAVKLINGGMKWTVGSLAPGQTRSYTMHCQLNTSGDLQLEVGARGKGELGASGACLTSVETIADLVLTVSDLKGPLPTGEGVPYTIKVRNRGTKAAKQVSLVMQFSEGVEPKSAKGLQHQIKTGQVEFSPIAQIDPGQEITLQVTAMAIKSGIHVFRAQLKSDDAEAHEIAEGTTRFYGDSFAKPEASVAEGNSFQIDK